MERKRDGDHMAASENKRPKSSSESVPERGQTTPSRDEVLSKLTKAAPFSLFLSRIEDEPDTHNEDLTITFAELLCLGELEHSVHFTFMMEMNWLQAQYAAAGVENSSIDVYCDNKYGTGGVSPDKQSNSLTVKIFRVETGQLFGHHHSKMSLLFYKNGSARVIIFTGNLIESNWVNETQGIWVSPLLPVLQTGQGDSITNFKTDLLAYLKHYDFDSLNPWIERLQKVDMSSVKVCFVASVPGTHSGDEYGYRKLRSLLTEHVKNPKPDWEIIAQCSSIGSLGNTPEAWLCGPFCRALSPGSEEIPSFSLIYPSQSNVNCSLDGITGCQGLRYEFRLHKKQRWLQNYLRQWTSDERNRTQAMPHIKSYAQVSPDGKNAGWFLMTSANVSKAAWGSELKKKQKDGSIGLKILAYEVGVLFLPELMIGESKFTVHSNGKFSNKEFPFPYDLPLEPYDPNEQPFFFNRFQFMHTQDL